jgi:hypothetical protein
MVAKVSIGYPCQNWPPKSEASFDQVQRGTIMSKKPAANTMPMIDQVAMAITKADGDAFHADPAQFRRPADQPSTGLFHI